LDYGQPVNAPTSDAVVNPGGGVFEAIAADVTYL